MEACMSTEPCSDTTEPPEQRESPLAAGEWRYGTTPPLRNPTRWPRSLAY